MTTMEAPANGVWVPLQEAASALGVSADTVRRRIKDNKLPHKMAGNRYMVHLPAERLQAVPAAVVIEDSQPSFMAFLEYLRERDAARDRELAQLRDENARLRADLLMAQAALPPGRPWGPFAWLRQLWVAQEATNN